MKILVAHNRYQRPGGEDVVFESETALLETYGHEVIRHVTSNDQVSEYTRVSLAARTVWNRGTYREIQDLIRRTRPDVVHVHNSFPLISPSIYSAAHAERVPVVQTLHNFRLVCPGATLYRDGSVCEDCLSTVTRWPSLVHGCYRGSRPATAAVTTMLAAHTLLGTWRNKVNRYIALSEFARGKFVTGGYPPDKIVVKPNFLGYDPGMTSRGGDYALFVGRLSHEKGLRTLLEAFRRVPGPARLKIAGQGPLMPEGTGPDSRVEWLGQQSKAQVFELMHRASMLAFPSECYEGQPLTILEAFASGLPVVASRHGAMAEMVTDGVTGLHFEPKNVEDLARVIEWAFSHPSETDAIARRARLEFERKYTADRNYEHLMEIYRAAMN